MVALGGVAVSYERGTPVPLALGVRTRLVLSVWIFGHKSNPQTLHNAGTVGRQRERGNIPAEHDTSNPKPPDPTGVTVCSYLTVTAVPPQARWVGRVRGAIFLLSMATWGSANISGRRPTPRYSRTRSITPPRKAV